MLQFLFIYSLFYAVTARNMASETKKQYLEERSTIFVQEEALFMGSKLKLNEKEKHLNEHLMKSKLKEIHEDKDEDAIFPPATHFFHSKELYDNSDVFKIIRKMPKGGVLHVHDQAAVDIRWVIKRATYDPNCYMCTDANEKAVFHFFPKPPAQPQEGCTPWKQIVAERNNSKSAKDFDQILYNNLSLIVKNPEAEYKTQDIVWQHFIACFVSMSGLFSYAPIFEDYYLQTLKEFYDDNVTYLELRVVLLDIYELDGSIHSREWSMSKYQSLTDKFAKDHPNFLGAKIIFTSIRSMNQTVIAEDIKDAISFHKKFPRIFAGYDLVSQEDLGHPLKYFLDDLLYPLENNLHLKYFFHAGETTWQGLSVDENLIDAVLLNTSRIGHGFALMKHPKVLEQIIEKGIAIEVNPISNQVLKLVADLRDHPMAALIAQDYPVIISCDDPGIWGASGLSYDFYAAFMGMAGARADLRMLKQCAINSIIYSAMTDEEKKHARSIWQRQWDQFINSTLQELEHDFKRRGGGDVHVVSI